MSDGSFTFHQTETADGLRVQTLVTVEHLDFASCIAWSDFVRLLIEFRTKNEEPWDSVTVQIHKDEWRAFKNYVDAVLDTAAAIDNGAKYINIDLHEMAENTVDEDDSKQEETS